MSTRFVGAMLLLSIERSSWDGKWSGGFGLSYLSNSFYRDGLVHNLLFGIGFQFD